MEGYIVACDQRSAHLPASNSEVLSPTRKCHFHKEPTTLLQRALHRAKQIVPTAQIVVTVREENRECWEPALWFIRPERRFVSDSRMTASLTTAAALLSIAADSVSPVVTILPGSTPARSFQLGESQKHGRCTFPYEHLL
jgi:hypothetical protein